MPKTITLNDDQIKVLRDLADYLNEGDFAQMYGVSESEAVTLATPWDDVLLLDFFRSVDELDTNVRTTIRLDSFDNRISCGIVFFVRRSIGNGERLLHGVGDFKLLHVIISCCLFH